MPTERRISAALSWPQTGVLMAFALAACLLDLVACASSPHLAMNTVHVTVDLYSGQPNPEWLMTPAQAAQFQARLGSLAADPSAVPPEPAGLGYRGLRVTIQSDAGVEQVSVGGGSVVTQGDVAKGRRVLRDPGRSLEKWLLHTGKGQLSADLLQDLLGE